MFDVGKISLQIAFGNHRAEELLFTWIFQNFDIF